MRVITSLDATEVDRDVVLTIGAFDGVHRGHRHLLQQLVARARTCGRMSAALTFDPHPRAVLQPEVQPAYLNTPEERITLMESLGLDLLVLLPFTQELAKTPASEFIVTLHERLRMRELWVSRDFALGQRREGNISTLKALAPEIGYALHEVEPLHDSGGPISSTRIRALLAKGHVARASRLLGRYYAFSGTVVEGARRGRHLGFRTANLSAPRESAMPANGVYVVWGSAGGKRYPGVANVGTRPSFDGQERGVEVHLLDYDGDLYGQTLRVEFVRRLRDERRFDDVAALVDQVRRDVGEARQVLTGTMTGDEQGEDTRPSPL